MVVMSESIQQFKNRLDNFWSNQDLTYNYRAELTESVTEMVFKNKHDIFL